MDFFISDLLPAQSLLLVSRVFQRLHRVLRASRRSSAFFLAFLLIPGLALAQQPYGGNPYPQQYGGDGPQGYGQYGAAQPYPQQSYPQQYGQQYGDDQAYSDDYAQPSYGQPSYGQQSGPVQAMTRPQLEQLVAPIALYPDSLVAQVLAAATYPAQVVDADRWLRAQGNASQDQVVYGADQQSWDPSVKSLTAFPQVLGQMNENIRWTVALGNAYYNQPQDVMDAIQAMRQRAEAAGNLQSTPQEAMTYDQGAIQLAPANPNVMYVPAYDPWTVYGDPVQPYPGFSLFGALGSFFGSDPIQYGLGIALSAFTHTSWGGLGWGLDWISHSLLFNHSGYYSHSTSVRDWGLPHGGPRAGYGHGGFYAGGSGRDPRQGWGRTHPEIASNGYRNYGGTGRGPGYGSGYGSGYGEGFRQQQNRLPENRIAPAPYRGYGDARSGYGRNPAEAWNREPQRAPQGMHPEQYGRTGGYGSGYGYPGRGSYGAQSPQSWANRPNPVFTHPEQGYRPPSSGYQRAESGGFSGFRGRGNEGFGQQQKSGGFHLFGGGGGHEYKAPKPPKMSSHGWGGGGGGHWGGHSGGGGHGGGGGHEHGGHHH